ncbi:hypothetical protein [Cellulomonas persica]|uniref:Uncharacterized protein n=1 Tax=Cellulomonas persica TaxID=76861 RepID=A0A510UYF3_9CELL|nr:hypothetical protein [Cellulomonas persica]GEK18541.1 hypothetical protein CPE01_22740 [Cellulomonas persica]
MSKKNSRRKVMAVGLAIVGVAGLSLASASQLNLSWTGNFQTGSVEVDASCQPTGSPITTAFSTPSFDGTVTSPWKVANVTFSGVDAECAGKKYEAAYKLATGDWVKLTGASAPSVGAAGGTLTVALPTGVAPDTIAQFALSIYG